ncbi:type VI secretion lipoprotein TssJ [Dongshaea marina]|uniref:type VI secretion lipoprotein TssJ n=1 Tax=Dongshaea marina TaxID=2047966 RepID=UPI00131F39B5|nr:type VI secretion lipoprotein TssJ [Dongshaea marina]
MKFLLPVLVAIILAGCSSSPSDSTAGTPQPVTSPDQIKWDWQPDALELTLDSSKQLNWYDGQSHSLMLCMYQLSDMASFNELSKTQGAVISSWSVNTSAAP